jgi:threonine dehydratase
MAGNGKVVAVVSGGNLDPVILKTILEGNIPPLA